MRPRSCVAALAVAGVLSAGCAAAHPPTHSTAAPLWIASKAQRPTKVLVVVEENKTPRSALAGMPHLAALAQTYGKTTAYKAVTHPSLPNYLALAGGSTFGVHDDAGPTSHPITGPSVFDRVIAGGRTAKTYAESMPTACARTSTSRYAVKHNPWAYFTDAASRAHCNRFDVPLGSTAAGALRADVDAGMLPTVGLVIPDICNDAHDCSLATADDWLNRWLGVIRQGADYRAGRLVIVVTFDEDDYSADNTVQTVVVSPYTSHVVANRALTHYSLTRYLAELTATSPLRAAATAPSLRTDFRL
ncbi:MAG: phosphatidylinositol-3-phosphatase [Actinomycetota bacterium]|jgi:acid phosphatase|nr:phosphatidylinositol-3-phosphatase [Actinomycetota bacterium]